LWRKYEIALRSRAQAKLSLPLKLKFVCDAVGALRFLHECGVLYRDLKPDNLLVVSGRRGG
jgi:serine/threonine protein kinase